MPLFGSRKLLAENDGRPAEEQLKYYLGGGPVSDTRRFGRIVKTLLKEKFSIDADAPTCGNDEKIGGLVCLASSLTAFRKAVLTLEGFPSCLKEVFKLTDVQLRYICLEAGYSELVELAQKVAVRTMKKGYLGMSDDYLRAVGTTSYEEALEMSTHIAQNDPRSEVDRFLKGRGLVGIKAIADLIEQRASEGNIRISDTPFETMYCTILDGNKWALSKALENDKGEMTKSLTWLACMELKVPKVLIEDLMIQMEADEHL